MVIDLRAPNSLGVAAKAWLAAAARGEATPELPGVRSPESLAELSAVRAETVDALVADGLDRRECDRLWDLLVWQLAVAGESVLRDELEALARTDPLTGLLNRRGLDEALDREIARARRTGEPVSLVVIDLDRFKGLNDTHGHGTGDAALRAVADLLRRGLRAGDVAGRWGGDEFAVVFAGLPAGKAYDVVDRLRATMTHPSNRAGLPRRVSFSAGVADVRGRDADGEELLARADAALYAAKAAGGNKARTIT